MIDLHHWSPDQTKGKGFSLVFNRGDLRALALEAEGAKTQFELGSAAGL